MIEREVVKMSLQQHQHQQQERRQRPRSNNTPTHDDDRSRTSEFQCPDCNAYLSLSYYSNDDSNYSTRYYCENCEQDVTAEEIISEWDSPKGDIGDDYESDGDDNTISKDLLAASNRGFY